MLFNSIDFLIFFPVVTVLYFLLPHKYRWALLLAASCYFYMAFIPVYILILAVTIVIDYIAGILIERTTEKKLKKRILVISIVSTCLVLFIFKYFNFFNQTFDWFAHLIGIDYPIDNLRIILPIGLSFHTFQSLSYVIEVYRGHQKAEKDFGIYALYVMFYPQLVAGPIERPQNLLWQFRTHHHFDYDRVVRGIQLMGWGMFKKVVIADRLSPMVDQVYNNPADHNGIQAAIATILFAYQIYCDFSGYSDIAIGAAQVMGFKLMKNFDRPYYSKSISEFWKRWHISLSTWFRDYLYISLGGNRVEVPRWYLNLFITFLVSGLWHGANWTFVIWGALHGYYLVFAIISSSFRKKLTSIMGISKIPWLHKIIQIVTVFALADLAWIFFRAGSVGDAFIIIDRILRDGWHHIQYVFNGNWSEILTTIKTLGFDRDELLLSVFFIIVLECVHLWQRHGSVRDALYRRSVWFRWGLYYAMVIAILWFGAFGDEVQFIYFQF